MRLTNNFFILLCNCAHPIVHGVFLIKPWLVEWNPVGPKARECQLCILSILNGFVTVSLPLPLPSHGPSHGGFVTAVTQPSYPHRHLFPTPVPLPR